MCVYIYIYIYYQVISAAARSGDLRAARPWLSRMLAAAVTPDVDSNTQ